jgi:hypothetical protein
MKSNNLIIIFAVLLALIASKCKEDYKPLPVPKPNPNPWGHKIPTLDTIWRSYTDGFSNTPILNSNNDVLMSSEFTDPKGEVFKLYDGKTGQIKWEWSDYLRKEEAFLTGSIRKINDAIILCNHNSTYAFNSITGQTMWKHYFDTMWGESSIHTDGDFVYHSLAGEKGSYNNYIFRTKYNQLNWELVCSYHDSTQTYSYIDGNSIAFANNTKGEKIMIYPLHLSNLGSNFKALLLGFNLNTQKYDWIRDYSDKYYSFYPTDILVKNNNVFIIGERGGNASINSFDANNGDLNWIKQLPEYGVSSFLYDNNIVVLSDLSGKDNNCHVISYNQNTGDETWHKIYYNYNTMDSISTQFSNGDNTVFKNYLFSTQCDNLLILNLNNGNTVFYKKVSIGDGCLQDGITVNAEKRWFYVNDRRFNNCYKLPDEVKY